MITKSQIDKAKKKSLKNESVKIFEVTMRNEEKILSLILKVANNNDHIRAVLLTGSRVNPAVTKDRFRDFDIIYIVTEIDSFINDKHWIDVFGERIILQLPDEMVIGDKNKHSFSYLMLFKDGNRIDLTLFPLEKIKNAFKRSSLTSVFLDKDNLFKNIPPPSNEDYLIKKPTQKQFADCCNELWWVSTYVAKGLCRNEIVYARAMMDLHVRTMFLKMIEWYIGTTTNFGVSFGNCGRNIQQYLSPALYNKVLSTYPDSKKENIWNALFLMTELSDQLAVKVADAVLLNYNKEEASNVTEYLKTVYKQTSEK